MIKNIVVTFILAASLATSIKASSLLEPCEHVDQLKPDPKNCSRFYECTLAGWVGNACGRGLEFNPDLLYCDYPENVKCPSDISLNDALLEPCQNVYQLIPDPKNCSRYYVCTLSGWVGNACPAGFEFNPVTSQCDYPENVKCPSDISLGVALLEPCQNVDQLKPDPKNCSRFYECTRAGWVGLACRPGLEFNPDFLYCDYPENVKCATDIYLSDDITTKTPLDPCSPEAISQLKPDVENCSRYYECTGAGWEGNECSIGLEFNPVTSLCDYPENVKCAGSLSISDISTKTPLEPCSPEAISQLKPDVKNCSRYYECTEAGWEGNQCSIGLEFNSVTSLCDYPENVVCPGDIYLGDDITTKTPLEPCSPEAISQLKPDVENCSRYYECTGAGWEGNACSIGLEFNPVTSLCDYPENVKCAGSLSTNEVRSPSCGPANYDELFPDPSNCNGFLECSSLGLVPFKCPSNLRFNPANSRCDWPWRVKC